MVTAASSQDESRQEKAGAEHAQKHEGSPLCSRCVTNAVCQRAIGWPIETCREKLALYDEYARECRAGKRLQGFERAQARLALRLYRLRRQEGREKTARRRSLKRLDTIARSHIMQAKAHWLSGFPVVVSHSRDV